MSRELQREFFGTMSILLRLLSAAAVAVLLGSGPCTCYADVSDSGDSDPSPAGVVASDLIAWLRDNGAYINEKLVVRHLVPDDLTSPRGVLATEAMDVGETLCHIPSKLIVRARGDLLEGELWPHCGTIRAVEDAMRDNGATPYGRYLLSQPKNYVPGFWSDAGQRLLLEMLKSTAGHNLTEYDELPPHGVDEAFIEIEEECQSQLSNPLYRQAAMLVQARADYDYMIPFYDMFNHHNGKYNIKHKHDPYNDPLVDEIGYEMVTTKAIRAGEELYNSYNHCNVCQELIDWIGTPEIFLLYGFVESMPQRWLFDFARVKFDLDWKDGDEATGEVVVSFLVPPSQKGIGLLLEELTRIKSFSGLHRHKQHDDSAGVSTYEWETLWQYYDALHDAMSLAVQSNTTMSDDVWKLGDDWWIKDGTLMADSGDHWVYHTKSEIALSDEL